MQLNWSGVMILNQANVNITSDRPGIYRLSYQKENNRPFFYIGQADNLKDRISQHLPGSEANICCNKYLNNYDCYFRYAIIGDKADRDACEAALYKLCGEPECCERIPDCDPCEINFE